jgi:hypothetical protein
MQLDEKTFLVNSPVSLAAFISFVAKLFAEKKYLTFTWRIGMDRSLDQNSLFHVWLTEWAAHIARISKKEVPPQMVEFLKRKVKQRYYRETGYSWMLDKLIDPATGEEAGVRYASSSDYRAGEMFLFLTWMQMTAAEENGLVLESKGQYAKLQREHEGREA